jgi:DNA-binding transcriptional LysR family regulator
MASDLPDLRLPDASTLLHVVRCGSVSGAARALSVTPSQASKAIVRLERALKQRLLQRSVHGVELTEAGRRMLPALQALLDGARQIAGGEPARPTVTLIASAFVNSLLVPAIAAALPEVSLSCLEMPPGVASAYAASKLFDVALTTSSERWPRSWVATRAGAIRKALYAPPALAQRLGRAPVSPGKLRTEPFVAPVYSYNGQVMPGDDGCPLDAGERLIAHRTQTLAVALELAASAGLLIFASELAAQPWVESGRLVEIAVTGWNVRDPLQVVCHERLSARLQRHIVAAARQVLGPG